LEGLPFRAQARLLAIAAMGIPPMRLPKSLIAAALLVATPAAAEPLPRVERLGASEPVLREINEMLVSRQPANAARLARLDALLAQIREPTPLRGLVQFIRAVHLLELERVPEARGAVDESIRLLPGYSAPLLVAAQLEAYADRPGPAADYLLRASEIDPQIVRALPPYELNNVLIRLDAANDARRMGRLAERMLAINWEGDDLTLRSRLAREAITSRLAAGNVEGARALVPQLVSPLHQRALLIDNRFQPLWQDIETWGGPRQERQWPLYLAELKARYEASNDLEAARRYADALHAANHDATLARLLGPLFARPLDRVRDDELLWVAPVLADALARLGRWSEIETMFAHAERTWPLGRYANAINVAGNRARLRLDAGDAAAALAGLEAVIANAMQHEGEVSRDALAAMHYYRACALQELGRGHQALHSVAAVLGAGQPTLAASLHLCFGRPDAARAALIAGLANEETRDAVLAFAQPSAARPMQSDYGRRTHALVEGLRRDPALATAVRRYGRILPYAASAGAPPERP
jgi:hypothetical protein